MILDSFKKDILTEDGELSQENQMALCETIIAECGLELSEAEAMELMSEGLLSEANYYKVKNDKLTRKKRLVGSAAITLARQNNDPLYKKLAKVYKQKRILKEAINKKYGSKAAVQVKKMLANNRVLAAKDVPIDKNTKPKDA